MVLVSIGMIYLTVLITFLSRLLGFEGIAEQDNFPTWMLEKRLALSSIPITLMYFFCRCHFVGTNQDKDFGI
jgi:branched-subunit amino acid transport protein